MRGHLCGSKKIRLIGPGGAGKSTIGALLAERLEIAFVDLDGHLAGRVGDLSDFIGRHGYDRYARENVETYCLLVGGEVSPGVVALSSGFMTYAGDIHSEYAQVRREIEQHPCTFVLLPSLDRDVCVAETVRRQIARPFGRSPAREEAVIRARFEIYMALPARKIETMRPVAAVVDEIVAALARDDASVESGELRSADLDHWLGAVSADRYAVGKRHGRYFYERDVSQLRGRYCNARPGSDGRSALRGPPCAG